MKRFIAFYGAVYYPSGGMNDFVGDFDTLEEAKISIEKEFNEKTHGNKYEWGHVWDSENKQKVWKHNDDD